MDKGVLICTVWNAGEKNLYYKVFDLSSVDLNGESILISEQVLKFCIDLTHKIEFVCLDMIGTMMIAGLNRGGMLAVDFRTKDGKDINMIHQENSTIRFIKALSLVDPASGQQASIIVSVGYNGEIILWDFNSVKQKYLEKMHVETVSIAQVRPGQYLLAVGESNGKIHLFAIVGELKKLSEISVFEQKRQGGRNSGQRSSLGGIKVMIIDAVPYIIAVSSEGELYIFKYKC